MDPASSSQILPISPPDETGFAAFFESFEPLQEGEKKPAELVALLKNIPLEGFKKTDSLKFHAQLLTVLHKTKSEIDQLLHKMETKEEEPVDLKRPLDLKENKKTLPSESPKRFETLAETSEKKALQILSKKGPPESKMSFPPAKENPKELNSPAKPSSFIQQTLPEPPKVFAKQNLLHLVLQQLTGALEMKILEKAPPNAILQKMQPLIEHLIVVVKMQEDMANPSPKLVQLVRFLGQTFSAMRHLSWGALFKPAANGLSEPSQKTSPTPQKEERRFERSSLETANPPERVAKAPSGAPTLEKKEPIPSAPNPISISNLFGEKSGTEARRELQREIAPWAAPYTAPKSEQRLRTKAKKKPKSPWRRSEKEAKEDDLP